MLNNDNNAGARPVARRDSMSAGEAGLSGVSWAAVFAGAAAAAALSLILLVLGLGLGFSAVSPWANEGVGSTAITISGAAWLALTQIIAAGLGGYLAGRLRVRWTDIHRDEVYFRDTAHGMLSWAVATLVTVALLSLGVAGLVGTGVKATGNVAAASINAMGESVANEVGENGQRSMNYFVDRLFRTDQPSADGENAAQTHSEASAILVRSIKAGALEPDDKAYLASLIAQRAGLTQAEAEQRVDKVLARANEYTQKIEANVKEAADTARKAAASAALWIFVALLCGAFFASLAAIWGGRRRDMAIVDAVPPSHPIL